MKGNSKTKTYSGSMDRIKSGMRVLFGLFWLIDAALKWQPGFRAEYLDILVEAANGQPGWLAPWFNFWIATVSPHVTFFSFATAVLETAIAITLIFGFARKVSYTLALGFSLLIWSTAEGFGGPYTAGATDIGTGIIYAMVFLAFIVLNANSGTSKYSLDYWLEKHISWWHKVAEIKI